MVLEARGLDVTPSIIGRLRDVGDTDTIAMLEVILRDFSLRTITPLVKRLVITLVVSALAFMATAWLLPNITVDRFLDGVIVVIVRFVHAVLDAACPRGIGVGLEPGGVAHELVDAAVGAAHHAGRPDCLDRALHGDLRHRQRGGVSSLCLDHLFGRCCFFGTDIIE